MTKLQCCDITLIYMYFGIKCIGVCDLLLILRQTSGRPPE